MKSLHPAISLHFHLLVLHLFPSFTATTVSSSSLQNIPGWQLSPPAPSPPPSLPGRLLGMFRSSPLLRLTDGSFYWEKVKWLRMSACVYIPAMHAWWRNTSNTKTVCPENVCDHLKRLFALCPSESKYCCASDVFVISETLHPAYILIWPDKSFPYKALMFAKCCVSVQLVRLRSPGWVKNSSFSMLLLLLVMLCDSAGEGSL